MRQVNLTEVKAQNAQEPKNEGKKTEMKYKIVDQKYHFISAFDTETGAYVRTGVLDEQGRDTGVDPFMASYPHLIDVGIMGHCIHGKTGLCAKAGIGCYQSGMLVEQPNMTLEDFTSIAKQSSGRCNQFALGGRGDPDQHEHFEEILKICRENNLVPNFTTSGYGMTPEIAALCKQYCGAVAVSWYRSSYTLAAIQMLLDAGVKTNIHYVLGQNSIDEAIARLEKDDFPKGINAVIFLLHKPAGQGTRGNMLAVDIPAWRNSLSSLIADIRLKRAWIAVTSPVRFAFAKIFCRNRWTPARAGVTAATSARIW